MGDEHLNRLEASLEKRGWAIVSREERINWAYAGEWEIQRSTKKEPIRLKFNAMDGMGSDTIRNLPSAWCCEIDGEGMPSLYFSKLKNFDEKLVAFIEALDKLEDEESNL